MTDWSPTALFDCKESDPAAPSCCPCSPAMSTDQSSCACPAACTTHLGSVHSFAGTFQLVADRHAHAGRCGMVLLQQPNRTPSTVTPESHVGGMVSPRRLRTIPCIHTAHLSAPCLCTRPHVGQCSAASHLTTSENKAPRWQSAPEARSLPRASPLRPVAEHRLDATTMS